MADVLTVLNRAGPAYSESRAFRFPRDRLATVEEYFALEETSAARHEDVHGQVHAMTGVTRLRPVRLREEEAGYG